MAFDLPTDADAYVDAADVAADADGALRPQLLNKMLLSTSDHLTEIKYHHLFHLLVYDLTRNIHMSPMKLHATSKMTMKR